MECRDHNTKQTGMSRVELELAALSGSESARQLKGRK